MVGRRWIETTIGALVGCKQVSIQTGPFGTVLSASEYVDYGIPVISVREIRQGRIEIYDETPAVSDSTYRRLSQFALKPYDLVFARKGSVDRSALIAEDAQKMFLGSDGIRLRFNNPTLAQIVFHCVQSPQTRQFLTVSAYGTTMAGLNETIISSIPICIPEDAMEQQHIAKALSDMDDMIASLEKLIAKKKAIKQGTMQELLTGKRRLPGFSREWKKYKVGEMGQFYSGLSGKRKEDFGHGKAKYITFLNVLSNVIIDLRMLESVEVKQDEAQNVVRKGDLFFNTSSETPEEVGMCATLMDFIENVFLNSFCFGFRLVSNDHDPLFLSYYFNSAIGRKLMYTLAQGATRYNLSKSNFADEAVIIPDKEEQTAIALVLLDMGNAILETEQKISKARQIKHGMMQHLLTGKTRLM